MNRLLFIITALLLFALGQPAEADRIPSERDMIYLDGLKVQPSVMKEALSKRKSPQLARAMELLEAQFTASLHEMELFRFAERKRRSEPKQKGFDANDKKAVWEGRMAGARFAVLPMIDGFEDRSEIVENRTMGRAALMRNLSLSAMVKVVDTATGKPLPHSPAIRLARTEEEGVRQYAEPESDQTIISLVTEVSRELSQQLAAQLRRAKVLTVDGDQVLINRGMDAGFAMGDQVGIYALKELTDDDTGVIFRNEVAVGRAIISRLEREQCFATVTGEDLGIEKECLVRIIRPASLVPDKDRLTTPEDYKPLITSGSVNNPNNPLNWPTP